MSRAQYIRDHYTLERTEHGWLALSKHGGIDPQTGCAWDSASTIGGVDRADVIRRARAQWGHFCFEDEAEAFGEIFPPQHEYTVKP